MNHIQYFYCVLCKTTVIHQYTTIWHCYLTYTVNQSIQFKFNLLGCPGVESTRCLKVSFGIVTPLPREFQPHMMFKFIPHLLNKYCSYEYDVHVHPTFAPLYIFPGIVLAREDNWNLSHAPWMHHTQYQHKIITVYLIHFMEILSNKQRENRQTKPPF